MELRKNSVSGKSGLRVLLPLLLILLSKSPWAATEYLLWYDAPPKGNWLSDHLPLGNSLFGASLMGGVTRDSLILNDATFTDGVTFRGYATLKVSAEGAEGYSEYHRDLDIGESVSHLSYRAGGKRFDREYFCSLPDTVLAGRYKADAGASISLTFAIQPQDSISINGAGLKTVTASGNVIQFSGVLNAKFAPGPLSFDARLYLKKYGGTQSLVNGNQIRILAADSVDLFFVSTTSYIMDAASNFKRPESVGTVTGRRLNAAVAKGYAAIRADHIKDYRSIFDRFRLDLSDDINKNIPTNVRVENYRSDAGQDRGLDVLFLQFGRYLLISSSRAGVPAALQGMWNPDWGCRWDGQYTTNVNIEMNYWGVNTLNMEECFVPYVNLMNNGKAAFQESARDNHVAKGYVAGRNINIYGKGSWTLEKGNFAWLMSNLYDQFLFDPDTTWLRRNAYDLLKGGSEAMQAWMLRKPDPADGSKVKLIEPAPAYSPENGEDEATACTQQQTADLWKNTLAAGKILGTDADFRTRLQSDYGSLDRGLWISPRDGRLQEFLHDENEGEEIRHRHVAHLLALYPLSDISPLLDTAVATAARKALVKRGIVSIDGAGWSTGFKVGLWARLGVGDSAYAAYSRMIANNVFPNLWQYCYADVIQMDGGQGGPAGVAEMLAQSHIDNRIQLLPALPSLWPKGNVKGLRCRGGFTLTDMSWQAGKLTAALIRSDYGLPCRLQGTDYTVTDLSGGPIEVKTVDGTLTWNTLRNRTYKILPGIITKIKGPGPRIGRGNPVDGFKFERSEAGFRIFVPTLDAPVGIALYDEKGARLADLPVRSGWNRLPQGLAAGGLILHIRVGNRTWVRGLPL